MLIAEISPGKLRIFGRILFMFTSVHTNARADACTLRVPVCMYAWRPGDNLECRLQACCPSSQKPISVWLRAHQCSGVTSAHHHSWHLYVYAGPQTRSSCFQSRYLIDLAVSPALRFTPSPHFHVSMVRMRVSTCVQALM